MGSGRHTGVNVGGSSILVIFILLCLTTFATLSMVSAGADLRLTQRAAATSAEYYAADVTAEATYAQISKILSETSTSGDYLEAYSDRILKVYPDMELERREGALLAQYAVPIGDDRELAVVLRIAPPDSGIVRCTREMWQVVSVGEWAPQAEGFDLWDGGGDMNLSDGLPPVF